MEVFGQKILIIHNYLIQLILTIKYILSSIISNRRISHPVNFAISKGGEYMDPKAETFPPQIDINAAIHGWQ